MLSDSTTDRNRWIVLGNPESRRVSAFRAALARYGNGDVCDVIPWATWLTASDIAPPPPGTIVRIESPGGDPVVEKLLLRSGIEPMHAAHRIPLEAEALDQIQPSRGEILALRQWFLGFTAELRRLDRAWGAAGIHWLNSPESIIASFDKIECLQRWEALGLPTPRRRQGVTTYHQLREVVPERRVRLFLKPRYGFSAVGAIALEWHGELIRAITTVESVWSNGRPRLFLSKRPRVLRREFEIAWLINTLAMEEVLVEDWLPKARWQGMSFDLRIVTIGGQPRHVVGRASNSPFTNLNLDGTRIDKAEVMQILGTRWDEAERLAAAAASALPEASMLGIDLLPRPSGLGFALLEANAFGDDLPRMIDGELSTHEAQVVAWRDATKARSAAAPRECSFAGGPP